MSKGHGAIAFFLTNISLKLGLYSLYVYYVYISRFWFVLTTNGNFFFFHCLRSRGLFRELFSSKHCRLDRTVYSFLSPHLISHGALCVPPGWPDNSCTCWLRFYSMLVDYFLQHNHCIIMKSNMLMPLIGLLIETVSPALSFLGGLCNQCRQSLREWRGN